RERWFHEEELRQLLGDRQELFVKGVRVAGEKCVLVKDELDVEGSNIMNLRTQKNSEGNLFFLSIGKTAKTFVIVKGSATAQGGQVANKLYNTVKHLNESKF
uniref:Profilin n=1 Tax=Takifugu rubripes TaxID=31033 RepID=A0A3B5JY84_TAKRU